MLWCADALENGRNHSLGTQMGVRDYSLGMEALVGECKHGQAWNGPQHGPQVKVSKRRSTYNKVLQLTSRKSALVSGRWNTDVITVCVRMLWWLDAF